MFFVLKTSKLPVEKLMIFGIVSDKNLIVKSSMCM